MEEGSKVRSNPPASPPSGDLASFSGVLKEVQGAVEAIRTEIQVEAVKAQTAAVAASLSAEASAKSATLSKMFWDRFVSSEQLANGRRSCGGSSNRALAPVTG